MRPGAIIVVAVLFVVAFVALLLGTKGYEKIEEIHTMESRVESIREQFPGVEHISPATLEVLIQKEVSVLIVDVRDKDEFAVSHLPGANNLSEADQIQATISEADSEIVVLYGSTGLRSAALAKELGEAGVPGIRNLAGSIFAWANEGHPMVNDKGESVTEVDPGDRSEGHLLNSDLHPKAAQ